MPTVLVVDDSAIDRRVAAECVKKCGADVLYAENGLEALTQIEQSNPDAVLTDLQMPEMDGLELVRKITESKQSVPVILMTAHGSEETAVEALKAGAASYVPKKNLVHELYHALKIVLAASEAAHHTQQVFELLKRSESYYVLGYEKKGPQALVTHLQDNLARMNVLDEFSRLQVCTALTEALTNAIDHGNLELDSKMREGDGRAYREIGRERAAREPYCDRRVHVTARITENGATFVIRDEGPGFDPSGLPDPTDPENLLKNSGRGVMLIQTFMDEVCFNHSGNEITMSKRSRPGNAASVGGSKAPINDGSSHCISKRINGGPEAIEQPVNRDDQPNEF